MLDYIMKILYIKVKKIYDTYEDLRCDITMK